MAKEEWGNPGRPKKRKEPIGSIRAEKSVIEKINKIRKKSDRYDAATDVLRDLLKLRG